MYHRIPGSLVTRPINCCVKQFCNLLNINRLGEAVQATVIEFRFMKCHRIEVISLSSVSLSTVDAVFDRMQWIKRDSEGLPDHFSSTGGHL